MEKHVTFLSNSEESLRSDLEQEIRDSSFVSSAGRDSTCDLIKTLKSKLRTYNRLCEKLVAALTDCNKSAKAETVESSCERLKSSCRETIEKLNQSLVTLNCEPESELDGSNHGGATSNVSPHHNNYHSRTIPSPSATENPSDPSNPKAIEEHRRESASTFLEPSADADSTILRAPDNVRRSNRTSQPSLMTLTNQSNEQEGLINDLLKEKINARNFDLSELTDNIAEAEYLSRKFEKTQTRLSNVLDSRGNTDESNQALASRDCVVKRLSAYVEYLSALSPSLDRNPILSGALNHEASAAIKPGSNLREETLNRQVRFSTDMNNTEIVSPSSLLPRSSLPSAAISAPSTWSETKRQDVKEKSGGRNLRRSDHNDGQHPAKGSQDPFECEHTSSDESIDDWEFPRTYEPTEKRTRRKPRQRVQRSVSRQVRVSLDEYQSDDEEHQTLSTSRSSSRRFKRHLPPPTSIKKSIARRRSDGREGEHVYGSDGSSLGESDDDGMHLPRNYAYRSRSKKNSIDSRHLRFSNSSSDECGDDRYSRRHPTYTLRKKMYRHGRERDCRTVSRSSSWGSKEDDYRRRRRPSTSPTYRTPRSRSSWHRSPSLIRADHLPYNQDGRDQSRYRSNPDRRPGTECLDFPRSRHGNHRRRNRSPPTNHRSWYPDWNPLLSRQARNDLLKGLGRPFDGTPEHFWAWRTQMKIHLREADCGPMDTLYILSSNTTGEPNEMVQNLLNTNSGNYGRTLDILWYDLEKCYGSSSAISRRLLGKLDAFPRITKTSQLGQMRRLLNICRSLLGAMESCSDLRHLDSREGLKKVCKKMPKSFLARWRRICAKIERRSGEVPPLECLFEHISDFVDEHADPTFEEDDDAGTSRAYKALATETETEPPRSVTQFPSKKLSNAEAPRKPNGVRTCAFHEVDGHSLNWCREFCRLPYEERRRFVIEKRLCFACLGQHMVDSCTFRGKCSRCGGKHCDAMHRDRDTPRQDAGRHATSNSAARVNCVSLCSDGHPTSRSCSKTLAVEVRARGSEKSVRCYAIIDEQSNVSFCDPDLVDLLEITSASNPYSLTTMSGFKTMVDGSAVGGLEVRGLSENNWLQLPELLTNPYIPDTTDEVATRNVTLAHRHIRHLARYFPETKPNYKVMLLLGVNSGETLKTTTFGSTYPYVHHTAIGWSLVGPVCLQSGPAAPRALRTFTEPRCDHHNAVPCFVSQVPDLIPRSFDPFLEVPGDDLPGVSRDAQTFRDLMKSRTTQNKKGNIVMPLPLKAGTPLPSNKGPVYFRTRNTLQRISKDANIAEKCRDTMAKYINAGHVEQIPENQPEPLDLVCYVNVFPVYQAKKDKLRLVFDSSATYQGLSLNDALLRGPDVTNRLVGVLLRFRLRRTAFVADVECMFHAFHVPPEHRDVLRFFWWKDNVVSEKVVVYRALVHIFGNKSSPAVATHGLRHTTTHESVQDLVEAKKFIHENFYVDDGLGCTDTPEEAIKVLSDARFILSKFNIRLHKIVSTEPAVLAAFPPSELASDIDAVDLSKSPLQTALGLEWLISSDSFRLRFQHKPQKFTKRGILSVNGSIFDPLGLVSPVALKGRILQRRFIAPTPGKNPPTYDWDEPLPQCHLPEWNHWVDELCYLPLLTIPRCLSQSLNLKTRELHVFADASSEGIGHVIYMRTTDEDDRPCVSFVFGSSKVTPRSATSIPRLELCAAMEAAQSVAYVSSELKITLDTVRLYSDSQIVLGYIHNTERTFSRYVTTRVGVILKNSSPSQWSYIASNENPADLASRPHSAKGLSQTSWLSGPGFLKESRSTPPWLHEHPLTLPETILTPRTLLTVGREPNYVVAAVSKSCSSWTRAIATTERVFAFASACRKQPLDASNLKLKATVFLLTESQKEVFASEYGHLKSGKALPNSNRLLPLAPFMDEQGLIRVGGRLSESSYPFEEKHPILLPPLHEVTTLVLRHCHERTWHQGRHLTLGALRQAGFYVLKQGKTISKFIADCLVCRKLRHSPKPQLMADLPADRLTQTPPFMHSGVDVFGHYHVHDGRQTRNASSGKKVWVLLVTCLYSRSVHLELLTSLDITSLKLALRRFTALRGECTLYRSDCGTNFVGARNLDLDDERKLVSLAEGSVLYEWKFLPPHASHFAGVWERKVGAIKSVLDISLKQLGPRTLSREEFSTFVQEAAAIVNHTPLGEVSADPNDPIPISPMSLLTLRESQRGLVQRFDEGDLLAYGKRRWRRVQYLADQFWLAWKRDYLKSLYVRRKWRKRNRNVCTGDVVLIREQSPRNSWPLGLVTDVRSNSDGVVRSVTIRISSSGSHSSIIRPVHDLVVITSSDEPEIPSEPET